MFYARTDFFPCSGIGGAHLLLVIPINSAFAREAGL